MTPKDSLKQYRADRAAFVTTLKNDFDIDYYKLDPLERKNWFASYLRMKMDFMNAFAERLADVYDPQWFRDVSCQKRRQINE